MACRCRSPDVLCSRSSCSLRLWCCPGLGRVACASSLPAALCRFLPGYPGRTCSFPTAGADKQPGPVRRSRRCGRSVGGSAAWCQMPGRTSPRAGSGCRSWLALASWRRSAFRRRIRIVEHSGHRPECASIRPHVSSSGGHWGPGQSHWFSVPMSLRVFSAVTVGSSVCVLGPGCLVLEGGCAWLWGSCGGLLVRATGVTFVWLAAFMSRSGSMQVLLLR